MTPLVHCVRHAQGEHNLGGDAYLIPDPKLTEVGIEECRALETRFPNHSSVELIVSSPLRRTLQTALCSFQPAIQRGVKIIALPELQETSDVACDTGRSIAEVQREFSQENAGQQAAIIDFSLVEEGWNSKIGKWAPSSNALIARARVARQWLRKRPEKELIVVCHGGFLHYLTQDWTGIKADEHASAWQNCDFRSYQFASSKDDDDAAMIETDQSRQARGVADEKVPTKEGQDALYLATVQNWEDRGFQNPLKLNEQFK
ncbi:putative phosphoglycerate mutase [Talaromyces proteolyticus]|uniref:Phosphoglycerate mutase n=1 Tax=Talaromyces proteolyticus TaxID=1131652 RepID=A0AAD4KSS6_9EURO|nr:putative phosphoglycerate mutase [Talaromyces proteolyticus]KAH8698566.1 putative phosphoglycerate mutase [Talaromyces proteolyticus]